MRSAFLLVAIVLVGLGAAWFFWDREREPGPTERRDLAVADDSKEPVLSAAAVWSPEAELDASGAGSGAAAREGVAPRARPSRSPIQGRIVLAATGEPLAGEFRVHLRTLDLVCKETLTTEIDGSFRSTQVFPRTSILALVEQGEAELVDHEAPFDPASSDPWLVLIPDASWAANVHGRVVDSSGKPCYALIQLFPMDKGTGDSGTGDRGIRDKVTGTGRDWEGIDESGQFALEGLARGAYRLVVQGQFVRLEPRTVWLLERENELGELVLSQPPSAGAIRGRLSVEGDAKPDAILSLRDARGEFEQRTQLLERRDGWGFTFPSVPAGTYELSVRGLDGRVYEPASRTVSPPAEGLEFRAASGSTPWFGLVVSDALTGAAIQDFDVWGRIDGRWRIRRVRSGEPAFPADFEAWIVLADGYRPARGAFPLVRTAAAPAALDGELSLLDVGLERGFGAVCLVQDAEQFGPSIFVQSSRGNLPLADVPLFADGRLLDTTDAEGLALLALDQEPRQLEPRLSGWSVVSDSGTDPCVILMATR